MYRNGKWIDFETTVCWLEIDPEDDEGLIVMDKTFSTIEERQEYIKERIESGVVYNLLFHTESSYGGPPRADITPVAETLANGFAGREGWEEHASDPTLYLVGRAGQSAEESSGNEGEGIHGRGETPEVL